MLLPGNRRRLHQLIEAGLNLGMREYDARHYAAEALKREIEIGNWRITPPTPKPQPGSADALRFVCSNKPKPRVQHGSKGHAGWDADVYHLAKSGIVTFCGCDCSEWLRLDPKPLSDAIADPNFCKRCAYHGGRLNRAALSADAVLSQQGVVETPKREWLVIENSWSRSIFATEHDRQVSGYIPRDVAEHLLGRSMEGAQWFSKDDSDKLRAHPEWSDVEPPNKPAAPQAQVTGEILERLCAAAWECCATSNFEFRHLSDRHKEQIRNFLRAAIASQSSSGVAP